MKKKIRYSVLCLFLVATPGFSQIAQKVNVMLNMGLGMQSYTMSGLCNGASFELGFTNKVSVGGYFDYAQLGTKFGDHQWKVQFVSFGVRSSYHLATVLAVGNPKFDPYAGISVGTRSVLHRDRPDHNGHFRHHPRGVFPGVHVGGLYTFSKKIGGYAELGWGLAVVRLGITGKF